MKVILASASPRRQELLKIIFEEFDVIPSQCDENIDFTTPEDFVKELSKKKAFDVYDRIMYDPSEIRMKKLKEKVYSPASIISSDYKEDEMSEDDKRIIQMDADMKMLSENNKNNAGDNEDALVIGSDTIVYCDGEVLGKPKDKANAKGMLEKLSGRAHSVYTGVCIIASTEQEPKVLNFYDKTDVYVDTLSDSEIESYIATGEPMDKAGSYGIQGYFSKHIGKIEGDYFNVVGLPVNKLYNELKKAKYEYPLYKK
ncbi:MAG: Maf family protein [Lachnospiraceae bacterium]|nr:Maf family protein [Lachnospiraceae bacterium]